MAGTAKGGGSGGGNAHGNGNGGSGSKGKDEEEKSNSETNNKKVVRRLSGKKKKRGSAMSLVSLFSSKGGADSEDQETAAEEVELNSKAIEVKNRIEEKLTGFDFGGKNSLGVEEQVDRLIKEATKVENLAVLFAGWSAWW